MPQASKASSKRYIPSLSQASTRAEEGGLCAVRMALKPTSFSFITFLASLSYKDTAPSKPLSWWIQPPFSFTVFPLIRSPLIASAVMVLMPNNTVSSSTEFSLPASKWVRYIPRSVAVTLTSYRLGWSESHSNGWFRCIAILAVSCLPAFTWITRVTVASGVLSPTGFSSFDKATVTFTRRFCPVALPISTCASRKAISSMTSLVYTYTPSGWICTLGLWHKTTPRNRPEPVYHLELDWTPVLRLIVILFSSPKDT